MKRLFNRNARTPIIIASVLLIIAMFFLLVMRDTPISVGVERVMPALYIDKDMKPVKTTVTLSGKKEFYLFMDDHYEGYVQISCFPFTSDERYRVDINISDKSPSLLYKYKRESIMTIFLK